MECMIETAKQFATEKHAGQVRKYTGAPYISHPARVAERVSKRPGACPAMICAAWMHDTVEDCGATPAEIASLFGGEVSRLVLELTNKPKVFGVSRTLRKAQDRERISRISRDAKVIKLIDRIDNINEIDKSSEFWRVYAPESLLLLGVLQGADEDLECELRNLLI